MPIIFANFVENFCSRHKSGDFFSVSDFFIVIFFNKKFKMYEKCHFSPRFIMRVTMPVAKLKNILEMTKENLSVNNYQLKTFKSFKLKLSSDFSFLVSKDTVFTFGYVLLHTIKFLY